MRTASTFRLRPSIVLLYLGFLTTGALTVLLGVVLPRVASAYHLTDSQSGALLMTLFAGSSLGALFVRQNFQRTLSYGYLLVPVAGILLVFAPRIAAIPAIFLYGLGLGLAMTSTSMMVGRLFQAKRGAALSFLNFCWSIGATLCPVLVAHLADHLTVTSIGITVAAVAFPFVALPLLDGLQSPAPPAAQERVLDESLRTLALFAAAGFLYVGVENAVGGWLTTYALRTAAWGYSRSSLTTACFWGALLAGRGVAPLVLERISETHLFRLATLSLMAFLLLLITAHTRWMLQMAAIGTGLSLAPIFPLVLSLFMVRAGTSRRTGWVFMVSGFGGAVLPWMTGAISTQVHSLRIGLLVPFGSSLLLLLMMLRLGLVETSADPQAATIEQPCSPHAVL